MIFEELVVHNFGPFAGRHAIQLAPPSKAKPVTLLGGLNGAGKTSLLDALNLALYGKRARCSKRGDLAYDTFLTESIHRSASPHEGAGVELAFRRYEAAREVRYRVRRTWSAGSATVRDRVEVYRDDMLDTFLTEYWNDQVEDFIPSGVADLFLFDGEKIERLADIDRSQATLQTAMQSLLGLGTVEHLENDLVVLERRKRTLAKGSEAQSRMASIEAEVAAIRGRRSVVVDARAAALVESESHGRALEKAEQRLRQSGGDLFAKRAQTEQDLAVARARVQSHEAELRELAAGALPLLLVETQLRALLSLNASGTNDSAAMLEVLRERDAAIVARAAERGLSPQTVKAFAALLADDRVSREKDAARAAVTPGLSDETRLRIRMLTDEGFAQEAERLRIGLEDVRTASQDAETLERYLAATPQRETLDAVLSERERARVNKELADKRVQELDIQYTALTRELEAAEGRLAKELETHAESLNEQEDAERTIAAAIRTRDILASFRRALLAKHANRLASLILGSFRQLLRKEELIKDLTIDPETLTVRLIGMDGQPLQPDRLSAGERPLLAVSMLWGLAQASGRPLPTVIDTPMGRLDSTHRERLVERYFPRASHQVLLLSTDEEIRGGYLDSISPYVGRKYQLVYDGKNKRSNVVDGYFW